VPGARSFFCLLGMLGCTDAPTSVPPTLPSERLEGAYSGSRAGIVPSRKPDAVVVDPSAAIPNPADRGDARGVLALREPLGGDGVRDLILAMIDAWQRESLDQLVALLTADAGPIESRSRGRSALVETWRQRLHAHEYRRLAGLDLVRAERIERYGWEDLATPDSPARPPEMRLDELFVRVPIEVTRVAGERLFGDAILVLLRREDGKYKIAAYGEAEVF
jgi:hypothetical protein